MAKNKPFRYYLPFAFSARNGTRWLVRKATLSDLYDIVALDAQSGHTPWSEGAYKDRLRGQDETVSFVIAPEHNKDQPHAFAIGRVIVDEFEILNIVVDQNDRGIGLGAMLLSVMRDHAVTRGCNAWILEVKESNDAAIRLYETQGLDVVGKRPGYYSDTGEAAILMRGALL